jgi:hypothetical protein
MVVDTDLVYRGQLADGIALETAQIDLCFL